MEAQDQELEDRELDDWELELKAIADRQRPRILERIRSGRKLDIVDQILLRMSREKVVKRGKERSVTQGSQSTLKR